MKYVKIEWDGQLPGYRLDPSVYQAELPRLAERMPNGAAEFATNKEHYDFDSLNCVYDLWLAVVSTVRLNEVDLEIRFGPYGRKHASGLTIEYTENQQIGS
jgi:hypothetical protein